MLESSCVFSEYGYSTTLHFDYSSVSLSQKAVWVIISYLCPLDGPTGEDSRLQNYLLKFSSSSLFACSFCLQSTFCSVLQFIFFSSS